VDLLDRALWIVRRGGWSLLGPAWAAGAVVATVVLGVYYLEIIEGVRGVRPALAVALVLAWCLRARVLSAAARRAVMTAWPAASLVPEPASVLGAMRAAILVGVGLWFWLWVPGVASFIGAGATVAVLPLLALRGAVAPSWLARIGCAPQGGWSAFRSAVGDMAGIRTQGLLMEALVLFGLLLLYGNLFVLGGLVASIGRSFAGVDVTAVSAFLSADNDFAWLAMGALTLVMAEPLRAAMSAVLYLESRFRQDGLDLEASVDAAVAASAPATALEPRSTSVSAAAGFLSFGTLALHPLTAQADARGGGSAPVGSPVGDAGDRDDAVRTVVDRILAQPEYQEVEGARSTSVQELLRRFFDWVTSLFDQDVFKGSSSDPLNLRLPSGELLLAGAAVLLMLLLVYAGVQRFRDRRGPTHGSESNGDGAGDPRERPPASHLDEAGRLAEAGRHREALRALYLATLVAFDRRGLIAFDPARTNWHYLRQLPPGPLRDGFGSFTRLFDHKWYGEEPTSRQDFERGRELATGLCTAPGEP
jgi:hypothetical protein